MSTVETRYKAYISYSHADEEWAAWLQRALESYRVPARLVAGHPHRDLPRRLAPVFRDREDLSSAQNLSDSLFEALHASDAMIVVCSPAAAASRWVNEEIRQFRLLGRADRIFCMVVDGDPVARAGESVCYPPALFEGPGDAGAEPLAADARKWADGKQLAKLKLIAALLGIRLDDLRQRDMKRRRRWQAAAAMAVIAAISLAVVTGLSVIAQRQERQSAEQMAGFIVELGEDLQSDVDLDTLGRISTRAMSYLQDLDPARLTPETSIKVGLALRQLGHVNLGQGRLPEALTGYRRSLGIIQDLRTKFPERRDVQFELAQAEFYEGNFHYEQGEIESARRPWERYLQISRELYAAEPDNPRWLLEVSYGTMNLLLLRVKSGLPADQALLDASDEAVDLARRTLAALPDDAEVMSHYSNTLAWAADAELLSCNLQAALDYRQETLAMAREAALGDPASNDLRERLAFAHSGVAGIQAELGELAESERHRRASLDILSELYAKDPTNTFWAADIAANRRLLANLLMNTQRVDSAVPLMQEVERHFGRLLPFREMTEFVLNEYADFVQDLADLMIRTGETKEARRLLDLSLEINSYQLALGVATREVKYRAALLRYLWFEMDRRDLAAQQPSLHDAEPPSGGAYRSCYDADLNARLAIVEGNEAAALVHVDYLRNRDYRNPGFMRFCRSHRLCPE